MADSSKILEVRGRGIAVEGNDIDTDRIIPARYLKEITFTNMGKYAFYDARFDAEGKPTDHPFNDPRFEGASILIVNKNFGCGSSREHAPQAIIRHGIRAIVGESFAEIFAGNCTVLGVPTVTAPEEKILRVMDFVRHNNREGLRLDLAAKTLYYGANAIKVEIADVIHKALTEGTWDSTQLMLANAAAVKATAAKLEYVRNFARG